jgi:hypothetical protein
MNGGTCQDSESMPLPLTIMSNSDVDGVDRSQSVISQRAYSRRNCVFNFREFILFTYREYLFSGNSCNLNEEPIVLDIAGGKGNLSWLFTNMDGIKSVIFDPRLASHSRLEMSVNYLLRHPKEAARRSIKDQPTHQPLAAVLLQKQQQQKYLPSEFSSTTTRRPKQVRVHVTENFLHALRQKLLTTMHRPNVCERKMSATSCYLTHDPWSHYLKDALVQSSAVSASEERQNRDQNKNEKFNLEKFNVPSINDGAGECVNNPDEIFEIIKKAKLIVGFHPDQATESCIDLAHLLGIPFAICPCCVFPNEFPDRRYKGAKVTNYDQFIEYLKAKYHTSNVNGETVKVSRLAALKKTSRNIVLYTHSVKTSADISSFETKFQYEF